MWRSASPTSYSPSPAFGSGLALQLPESRHGCNSNVSSGLEEKNFTVAMARGDIWLQRISCSAARGASAIATADQARAARLLAVLAVSGQQRNQIHHRPAGEAAVHWPAATRQMQPCSLAVWLSGCLSISLRLRKPSHRIGLQRCNRGRGGGARESRHVAEAPPKSGLAGKGGPCRRERRLRGPWRWTLEAWPRCWRTLREPPTAAAPSRRVWGSPHGGSAGPGGC